jgi:FkbM family methyltransferase
MKETLKKIIIAIDLLKEKIDKNSDIINEIRSLTGPFGVQLNNEEILVQTIYGNKYIIDSSDLIMAPQLITYRQWESDLSSLLFNSVNKDTKFIDIGANFGYFTCLAASKIGPTGSGKVYSFEPNPKLFKLLEKNSIINWSMAPITLNQFALGSDDGDGILFIPNNGAANATLTNLKESEVTKAEIKIKKLDSILACDENIDIIKIDVEGYEYDVLRGATRIIKENPNIKIVIEWSIPQMNDAKININEFINFIHEQGLKIFHLPEKSINNTTIEYGNNELLETHYANILIKQK